MDEHDDLCGRPFTLAEAAARGLSTRTVQRMADAGELTRLSRGLYAHVPAATYDVDLLAARLRAPASTICLTSALARHDLIDEIPTRIDLALPRGDWRPTGHPSIRWHLFDARTFDVGRTVTSIAGSPQQIGLYDAERSIVDAFRLRSVVSYETAVEAMRTWLRRPGSTPAAILAVAQQLPRAEAPVRQALSFLA
jgi:predicted transcriptional regulator of viral defense system